ncbi:MAG: hypothetical protein QOG42_899 [Solirubrobacteraceae bacterium]|nr:hypothetical protein [Solirubrobacteraceae bacterium]
MEREPSTATGVEPPTDSLERAESGARAALTPAQDHALRRSAPLTPEQFKSLRQMAARGINPVRRI